ncbi:phosphatase PAP2 family protein [Paenibacillus sp. SC116]|uniref:phosphatase PAP2 family protein n=1 Tax=Paenibacillus sp. SC116 TaxID=2968986 RepID=UPI00215B5DA8|nr:phosphatase PAP2 family protein [Paenibacillus sp. SC116]MCR8843902.1 phosphatase PAP2 family protein [Paenibacillus sp. SC116]
MTRLLSWLLHCERQLFFWINHRMHHRITSFVLYSFTHLGGATFTIACSSLVALFSPAPWSMAGWQALIALGISHIPVVLIKKVYPRLRPHVAMPDIRTFRKPLVDHSFPSGHSTAAFSIIVPFIALMPQLSWILIPAAGIVALSRMYLGLHYPSDCLAGAILGAGTAALTVSLWPSHLMDYSFV